MSALVVHPGWCDPRRCFETEGDVEHCSALVGVATRDARLSVAWVRADGFEEAPGQAELRIEILREGRRDDPLYLLPREAYQLAEQLLSLYWAEHYQRSPRCVGVHV